MPQEVQNIADETKLAPTTSVVTSKMKAEQRQNKNDDVTKSLKRTAPTDVTGQGDAKRKATQGSKKSEKPIEGANLKATDPTTLAANAAAILSSVPSSVAQNVVGQSIESTNPQFDNVLTTTTYSVNSMNSPIAVAPLISNQPTTINDISPMLHSDMGELMDGSAVQEAQAQSQDNSGNKRAISTRNLTNDERRQRRLLRNRVAAKECRRKKKAYVADLEEKVTRLEEENLRLHKEVEELNAKLNLNAMKLEENARLHKEIEELKIQLNTTQEAIEPTKQEATTNS